jgi:hypothetical protein
MFFNDSHRSKLSSGCFSTTPTGANSGCFSTTPTGAKMFFNGSRRSKLGQYDNRREKKGEKKFRKKAIIILT